MVKYGHGRSYPSKVLWLGSIPRTVTDEKIANLAATRVDNVFLDNTTRTALIFLTDFDEASQCIARLKTTKIDEHPIVVDFAPIEYLNHRFGHLLTDGQEINKQLLIKEFPDCGQV
ncbi:hypothetical protein ACOME3_009937 [Neoechinorhynchus agilis]